MIVVVTGVSGSGKTTIGRRLATALHAGFVEGDDFHAPESVAKMTRGIPLTDEDRWPWLARLNARLQAAAAAGESLVLACSALKRAYRSRLAEGLPAPPVFVFLQVDRARLAERLAHRHHAYMPPTLLHSQLAAWEPPDPGAGIVVDASGSVDRAVEAVLFQLSRRPS